MKYIADNIEIIKNIKQVPFNVIKEIEIGLSVVDNNSPFLVQLKNKLEKEESINISREDILNYIENKQFTTKEIVALIFLWGNYFTVMRGVNSNYIKNLVGFLEKKNDRFYDDLKNEILKVNYRDKSSIENIFKKFQDKKYLKIDGIGYAFFTKLFFFFSKDNRLPILDKWLLKSFVYLVSNDDKYIIEEGSILEKVILNAKSNKFLLSGKPSINIYLRYVEYLNDQSNKYNISINQLETFLFGWALRGSNENSYTNPRVMYNNYLIKEV